MERYDECKAPSVLDSLIFHLNQLMRFVTVYCDDDEVLERIGVSLSMTQDLQEETQFHSPQGMVPNYEHHRVGPGRPRFEIRQDQLEHLLTLRFSCPQVASILGVSPRTIRRRLTEYGLSVSATYTVITDNDLEQVVMAIKNELPNCGYRMIDGHLRSRGIHVTQSRIRSAVQLVDPEGVAHWWRHALKRRQYRVSSPLAFWHIDGNHKLIRYYYDRFVNF